MNNKRILHLHLRYKYFDAIAAGTKLKEYREAAKWKHKLDSNDYTHIMLYRGYQKKAHDTVMELPYCGYELKTITHPHFGPDPVQVCAIDVSDGKGG